MNNVDTHILLVEDEPALQFVFKRQLQALGYRVSAIADNGLSAVEKVMESPYQLVFMDVRIPGIDGILATKQIRNAEKKTGSYTPIVGMTAFAERELCLDAGMDDFLQKPILLDTLAPVLAKWLIAIEAKPASSVTETGKEVPDSERFKQTDEKLKAIQDRITDLRKRVGLE